MRAATVAVLIFVGAMIASSPTVSAQQLAPTDLQATASGSSVVITWRAAGSATPDGFRLEAGTAPGLSDLAIVNIPWTEEQGREAKFAAGGVAPGVYHLRVREVRGGIAGEASSEVIIRVGASACALPNAPRDVGASIANGIVTLNWQPAASGGAAVGYVVEAGSVPGAPNVAIIAIDATTLAVGAPPGRYFVRLRAMGACGASEPSPEVVVVVP